MKSPQLNIRAIQKHLKYGARIRPDRDWIILLSISAVLLVFSILWNLWLFSKVTNGEAIGAATTTPATTAPKLDGVQGVFDARSAEQEKYESDYRFVDPSVQ